MFSNAPRLFACLLAMTMLASAPHAQSAQPKPAQPARIKKTDPAFRNWREALLKLKLAKGCYTADYPKVQWRKIGCKPTPNIPFSAAPKDYSAQVSGHLSLASGFFTQSGVTSESALYHGVDTQNAYSIQLNTNTFTTSACAGHPSCKGWEQFIYATMHGGAFIQYWLLHYGTGCPSGWNQSSDSCFRNSETAPIPLLPATTLGSTEIQGWGVASDSTNRILIWADTTPYQKVSDDYLGLLSGWNIAELNVFGPGGSSGPATFNSGSQIWVFLNVDNGSNNAPTCIDKSFTAEKNNLIITDNQLVRPGAGQYPRIAFLESYPASVPPRCYALPGSGSDAAHH